MRSKAQRRYLWAREPEIAALFELETKPGARLPEYVGDTVAKKKAKKKARKKAAPKKARKKAVSKKSYAKKARAKKAQAKKARAKKAAHAREAGKLERQALGLLKRALAHKKRAAAAK